MWDVWSAFEPDAKGVFFSEKVDLSVFDDVQAARHEAISYAAYRLLLWRFKRSPNFIQTESAANRKMQEFGYDITYLHQDLTAAAALGNLVAQRMIDYGLSDGSNESNDYANLHYQPVNKSLAPLQSGNPNLTDPNRWQPLDIPDFVGQSGEQSENYPPFVGPEWGNVKPFSLTESDATIIQRDGQAWRLYLDPGKPPMHGTGTQPDYIAGFSQVVEWSARLDPDDGLVIDVSPAARGNNALGLNNGKGHELNPRTKKPYQSQWVHAGDYFRVLAEFWADGPSSETPPGHWFVMLNFANSRIKPENRRFMGIGEPLDELEWDLRSYLAMGGAMHDVAVAAWSNKGWYDYTRPISAIRFLCDRGQSTDPVLDNYNAGGIELKRGLIEVVTEDSGSAGGRHGALSRPDNQHIGKIAVKSWRGPSYVKDVKKDVAGVGWILCEDWWPYQRPNFVTPPFAGYVSGHSTFSRAAAEVLTLFTGSEYFPDGLAVFTIPKDTFLKFERGPSKEFKLQWATYADAADESAISRIYGGIHPTADDVPGRLMGYKIGHQAFAKAREYFPN